jgi:hypothetical protein
MISVDVLADTVCRPTGARVTTFLLVYPRYIHCEVLTHRVFSRNSASSRAVPVSKMIRDVLNNPVIPFRFGSAKKGMQDGGQLPPGKARLCRQLWLLARYPAVAVVWLLAKLGLHKQVANRLLEPWLHMTVVLTGTQFRNFYRLRCHPAAQPEFQELAREMLAAHAASTPREIEPGEWHMPFTDVNDILAFQRSANPVLVETLLKRATARCARTSYVNFYGKDSAADDVRLHDDLMANGHWSPFEHCCQAAAGIGEKTYGNLRGYRTYRSRFINENGETDKPFDPRPLAEELLGGGVE